MQITFIIKNIIQRSRRFKNIFGEMQRNIKKNTGELIFRPSLLPFLLYFVLFPLVSVYLFSLQEMKNIKLLPLSGHPMRFPQLESHPMKLSLAVSHPMKLPLAESQPMKFQRKTMS